MSSSTLQVQEKNGDIWLKQTDFGIKYQIKRC